MDLWVASIPNIASYVNSLGGSLAALGFLRLSWQIALSTPRMLQQPLIGIKVDYLPRLVSLAFIGRTRTITLTHSAGEGEACGLAAILGNFLC